MGYNNVYAFRDGLPGWIKAGYPTVTIEKLPKVDVPAISPGELKQMMDDKTGFVMVDIRKGFKDDKFWIDYEDKYLTSLDELENIVDKIDKDKKIVIVDLVGKRSNTGARYMAMKGFDDVAKLSGGIEKWIKDGFPTAYPE